MSIERKEQPARRTEKVAEWVAREILRDVAEVPTGTMLPSEAAMQQQYGVSRGSLREALRILEVQGLLAIKPGPGGGPVVTGVSSVNLARTESMYFHVLRATYGHMIAARLLIEPAMAELAAQRTDRDALSVLNQFLDPGIPETETDDEYKETVAEFHRTVGGLSGNPILDLLSHSLIDIYRATGRKRLFPPSERERIIEDHATIAKAILAGDGPLARQLMYEHMLDFSHQFLLRYDGIGDEIIDWH